MIRAAISWYSAGPIIELNGQITANDYVDILGHHVHLTVQMLRLNNDAIFKDGNSPLHTARSGLRNMRMHFNNFHGQHNRDTSTSSNHCGQY